LPPSSLIVLTFRRTALVFESILLWMGSLNFGLALWAKPRGPCRKAARLKLPQSGDFREGPLRGPDAETSGKARSRGLVW